VVRVLANVTSLWREESKDAGLHIARLLDLELVSVVAKCLQWAQGGEGNVVHFRADLLRLTANITFSNPRAQSELAQQGVLLAILGETRINETNPCVREWAIVCIRYLTENHPANQQLIASLQMKGVANEAEMADLNIKVGVGPNGKVKVSNLRPVERKN